MSLSSLKEVGSEKTDWYKVEKGKGQVKVTTKRTVKRVEDLEVKATSTMAKLNNKVMYVLGIVRRQLAGTHIKCVISVAIKLVSSFLRF